MSNVDNLNDLPAKKIKSLLADNDDEEEIEQSLPSTTL